MSSKTSGTHVLNIYKVDATTYLIAPGLVLGAMLLQTKVKLDLITYVEMLSMIERQKRGGLCCVGSKRHVKRNNKYLQEDNSEQEFNYLMHWDASNLYGISMSDFLPCKHLRFEEGTSLTTRSSRQLTIQWKCYIVEVDLEFPNHLHDKVKKCAPAPESLAPEME